MPKYLLAAAIALALIPTSARAQQYAAQLPCQIPLDGGAVSVTNTCGPILLNYQPTTVNCQYGSQLDSAQGKLSVLTSGDGVHFGTPTSLVVLAAPDGGPSTCSFGPFGSTATGTPHAATDVCDFSINPTDPYQYAEVTATVLADGGGAGDGITCYFSVVQTQTLHAPHGTINASTIKPKK